MTCHGEVIILRCCRDWPVHLSHAYGTGTCGLCRERPTLVFEPYRKPGNP